MFAFFMAPQRFIFSPIARFERRKLKQLHKKRAWYFRVLDALILLPFMAIAALPLKIYMRADGLALLIMMTVAIHGICLAVGLRTMVLASDMMAREKLPGKWDLFVLTGMDARQMVLGKWWATLEYVWWLHVLTAFLRLGLAGGYAQLLHADWGPWQCPFGVRAFCHVSHNSGYGLFPVTMEPSLKRILVALAVLLIFAILEVMLLAALGILSTLLIPRLKIGRIALMLILRGVFAGVAIGAILATEFNPRIANHLWSNPYNIECSAHEFRYGYSGRCQKWIAGLETVEIGLMSPGDDGGLIATQIMRPSGRRIFIVRNLVSAGIGGFMFLFFTWLFLRIATWLAVRQGATRPGYI